MVPTSKVITILCAAASAQAQLFFHSVQEPLDSRLKIPSSCDCTGVPALFNESVFICGDPRLGPVELPRKFPLLDIVSTYDRFGGLRPAEYLKTWWNDSLKYEPYKGIKGGWKYPLKDGFLYGSDDVTVQANTTLAIGTVLDRFGSETGKYVAAADAPFNQRALPPSNLNPGTNPDYPNDYHIYKVIKPLPVLAGVIAPGFGQPGLGAQFYLGYLAPNKSGTVLTALDLGYIARVSKSQCLEPGDPSFDPSRRCGLD